MPKSALVILADGFEEIEAVSCIDILRRAQIQLTIAGLSDIKIRSARNLIVTADKTLDEIKPEFDACVIPGGGTGAKNIAASKKVLEIIKEMHSKGKLIAAICASPAVVLSPLGILKDKSATCYPGMQELFNDDVAYEEEAVVCDKNIITSRGPATSISFALKIVESLIDKKAAKKIAEDILYS